MTITPPDNLGFGTVTGRFVYDLLDSADEDLKPDLLPMSGTVTFTASVSKVVNLEAEPDPFIMGRTQIRGVIDEQGYLCTQMSTGETYRGVNLFATTGEGLIPANWYWTVTYNLKVGGVVASGFLPHDIAVPAGSVQDLSNFIPTDGSVPISPSLVIALNAQAIQRVAEATAVRDEMEALLDNLGEFIITDAEVRTDGRLYFIRPDDSEVNAGLVRPNLTVRNVTTGVAAATVDNADPTAPKLDLAIPAASWSSTALGTTDLNTVTTPGLYGQANGADATTARNYPAMTPPSRVVLKVTQTNAATILQELTPVINLEPRVTYMRRLFNSAWSAWRAFPSQRVAQTSGQLAPEIHTWDDVANAERQIELLGTNLGTTDLNTLFTPGKYRNSVATDATLARNYPSAPNGGAWVIEVLRSGATTGGIVQRAYRTWAADSGRGHWMRTIGDQTGAWSAWRYIGSHRVDQSVNVGRAIYLWDEINSREQLIYGDTGWRDVKASLINGWAATSFAMRRTLYTVEIRVVGLNPAAATSSIPMLLPSGWAGWNNEADARIPIYVANNKLWAVTPASNFTMAGWAAADPVASFSITYLVNAAWPTALPGVALGAIPNV